MTDMPSGLIRRGGAYSLRRRVPLNLIAAYGGRKEIVKALGTNDYTEAKRLHARLWVALDEEFSNARLSIGRPPVEATKDANYGQGGYLESLPQAEFEAQIQMMEEQSHESGQQDFDAEGRQEERDAIRALATRPLEELSDKEMAIREVLEDYRYELERLREDGRDIAPAHSEIKAETPPSQVGVEFPALIDMWATERKAQPRTKAATQAVVRWFIERGGPASPNLVSKSDLLAFKRSLIGEGISHPNIEVKLRKLSSLFAYAYANAIIDTDLSGVKIDVRPEDRRQRTFYDELSLTRLFAGPVHKNGERPIRGRGEASYWMPLLALYTGARLEELAQLRPIDVSLTDYRGLDDAQHKSWFLKIHIDASGSQKLKNLGSRRQIPIHSQLVRAGFLSFVEDSLASGEPLLFPKLRPDGQGRLGAKWGEWFTSYRRNVCGLTDPALTFHSFRHTFARYGRDSGVDPGVLRALMGHSGRDVSDAYGKGYGHHRLVGEMEKYRVPGFDLPSLQNGEGMRAEPIEKSTTP